MVLHSFPQTAVGTIVANTNYPPQSGGENTSPPPVDGFMEYEDLVTMAYEGTWFDLDFLQRIPLTVNGGQVASPQTNFPTLINDTYPDLIGEVQAEIRITDGNSNLLDYEIQQFDNSTGLLIAWARKPTLTDSDVLFIYFDNAGASDAQNVTGVWDSTYAMVLHMIPNTKDSTANNNDPVDNTTLNATVAKIGQARTFGIAPDKDMTVADSVSLQISQELTISCWARALDTEDGALVAKDNTSGTRNYGSRQNSSNGRFLVNPGTPISLNGTAGTIQSNTYYFLVCTYNSVSGGTKIYFNGVLDRENLTVTGNLVTTGGVNVTLGMTANAIQKYVGDIDEARISNSARSADYILTEFNNQNSQSTFYSTGAVENVDNIPPDGEMEYEV